jgi:hypothetical protein
LFASTWIYPTAQKVAQKLQSRGFTDGSKLRVVGHSLGSIMSTEIGKQFSGAGYGVFLDPPSDPCFGDYNVQISPDYKKDNLSSATRTNAPNRSFVGANSLCGSQDHNRTALKSFRVDFQTNSGSLCQEHGWVHETFARLLDDARLDDNTLGVRDWNMHNNWQTDSGGIIGWQGNNGILKLNSPNNNGNTVVDGDSGKHVNGGNVEELYYKTEGVIRILRKKYQ